MADYQRLLKEAQERFNLIKWNRIETQEKVDAFDTEMASIRGEVRLLDRLVKEEEEAAKAKAEKAKLAKSKEDLAVQSNSEKEFDKAEKKEEGENIPEQKEVRTE